ncbi:C2 domain containing protein, partial [Trichomonas vaginalis G3]
MPRSWEETQINTFTRWVNSYLRSRDLKVNDLKTDLCDGRLLINLCEILTKQTFPKKWHKTPKLNMQKLENCHMAVDYINKDMQIKLVGIGGDDVNAGNLKLILGLIWSIINKYQVEAIQEDFPQTEKKQSGKEKLLNWAKTATADHKGVNITDFSKSWRGGLPLCAIFHHYLPDCINYDSIKPEDSINEAFSFMKRAGVNVFIDPQDLEVAAPDEKSIVTQVSELYHTFKKPEKVEAIHKTLKPIPGFINCTVVNGRNLAAMDKGGKSDPYVIVKINKNGNPHKTEIIKETLNPDFNQDFTIQFADQKVDSIILECYDWDDHNSHDLIGTAEIQLNQYVFNRVIERDIELKKEGGHRKERGTIHFRFILLASLDNTDSEGEDNVVPEENATPVPPIVLNATVIDARDLPAMDADGQADPFCILTVNGKGEQFKTRVIKNNLNPVWNHAFNIPINNQFTDTLYVNLIDFDETTNNDLIGYNKISLRDLQIGKPEELQLPLRKLHAVRTDRGTVHLMLQAYKPGEEPEIMPPKEEEPEVKAFVDCKVISATKLVAMDSNGKSDPYVVLKYNKDGEPQKTEICKKTLNPEWNQDFTFTVVQKKTDILYVECWDWDDHNSHDLIGVGEVKIEEFMYDTLVETDVELKKEGGHRKERGTVHLRIFVRTDRTGETDNEMGNTESEGEEAPSAQPAETATPIVVHCTVVDAKDLPAMDINGKADPFCQLTVNGKGQEYKTEVVMKNKNPTWNQSFNIPVEDQNKDHLYVTLFDFDKDSDNDLIGYNRIKLRDLPLNTPVEREVELKKKHGLRPDRGVAHLILTAYKPGEEPQIEATPVEEPVKSEVPPKAEFLDCTVVSASNLVKMDKHGLSDPYVVLKVNKDGEPQKTEVVKQNLNPEWNQEFHFTPVDKTKDVLVVECYDWDDHNSHDLIGNAILELAQYAYDIPIEADVELKKEGGHRKDRGTVHLRFTIRKDKTGEPDDEHTTSEEENNKAVAKADPIVLHCTVVDGVELPAMDITGFSDPFVRLTVNGQGKPYTTGIVMRELNPIWNQEFNIPIDNQNKDKLYITCYDWDEDSANDLIGYYRLPLDDIKVGEPVERECILKKKHALRANRGKIHLKICAFKPGEEPQVSKVPGAHPIKNIKPKETLLDATVVNARDLVPMDKNGKSDPYVILKLNRNGIPQQTTVVKASLNPDINENFDFTLIDPKTDVLLVYCYDWDDHNNHDLIGVGEIPLEGIALDVPVEKQVELKKEGGHRKERGKVNLKLRLHNSRDG